MTKGLLFLAQFGTFSLIIEQVMVELDTDYIKEALTQHKIPPRNKIGSNGHAYNTYDHLPYNNHSYNNYTLRSSVHRDRDRDNDGHFELNDTQQEVIPMFHIIIIIMLMEEKDIHIILKRLNHLIHYIDIIHHQVVHKHNNDQSFDSHISSRDNSNKEKDNISAPTPSKSSDTHLMVPQENLLHCMAFTLLYLRNKNV
eukprot:157273_1